MHRKSIAYMLAFCCLFLLQACSALKLSYNNAPELITWVFDGYLDFNDGQGQVLRPQLAALHRWHRNEELPIYVQLLESWQNQLHDDITPTQVCQAYDAIRVRMRMFNEHAVPVVLAVTPSLAPEQLTHAEKRFAKRNKKWRDEWMQDTQKERHQYRLEQPNLRFAEVAV